MSQKNVKTIIGHKKILSSNKRRGGRTRAAEIVKISTDIGEDIAQRIALRMLSDNTTMKNVINKSLKMYLSENFLDKIDKNDLDKILEVAFDGFKEGFGTDVCVIDRDQVDAINAIVWLASEYISVMESMFALVRNPNDYKYFKNGHERLMKHAKVIFRNTPKEEIEKLFSGRREYYINEALLEKQNVINECASIFRSHK